MKVKRNDEACRKLLKQQLLPSVEATLFVCLIRTNAGETDLLFPASFAQLATMRQLRQDCGGLLFLAIGHDVGEAFGMPYLQDLHTHDVLTAKYPVLAELKTNDLRYDSRSAFTLSINHRETYTGITDHDRALTTRRFAELSATVFDGGLSNSEAQRRMGAEFRTPGHIPVCRESKGGTSDTPRSH